MKYSEFLPVESLLEDVGKDIADWRNDLNAKTIHSEPDFKTEADRRAHSQICGKLNTLFPGVDVISEEDSNHFDKRPSAYWLIDPIDGTSSWYHGFDGFVTQAAYIENDIPVFGAVCAPVFNKTWSALKGNGACLNSQPLARLKESSRLILVDNTKEPHGIAEQVMSLLPVTGYVESGSLGLKSVLVADGTVDLFIKDVYVRDWDLAPAAVILEEVGGCLAQANGEPYIFNGPYLKEDGFIVARDSSLLKSSVDAFNKIKEHG